MSDDELMDIVDDNNKVIGQATRKEIREKNLLHRGSAVLVYNSKGQIFVHKRTANKKQFPSYWDLIVGGAVEAGEEYDASAKRETEEEIGVKNPELKHLFTFRYDLKPFNCFYAVYKLVYDGEMKLQEDEIEKGMFITEERFEEMIKTEKFSPDTIGIWTHYKEWRKSN